MQKEKIINSASQNQIQDLLFSQEIGWKEIIYDLINTEQLNPWDIDIAVLSDKYLERISKYEEDDFFMSSKVLLAAALLLRIKSEILLNQYIKSIDEILFGKKEEKKYTMERIELDEEIPLLIPKSPMPRYKRVTLKELISALDKAVTTENRRIKKEILNKNALRETGFSLPKRKFNIKDKIKSIHETLLMHFTKNKEELKISLTELVKNNSEEKIISFSPLLHLENSKKVWLEQKNHFEEIHIWMHKTFLKHNGNPYADLMDKTFEKSNSDED
jgi:segregation and condensation protein A